MKCSYVLLGALASSVSAHTWVEQLMMIAPNGTLVGDPGYPRGNVKRGTPGFGDPAMVNLIPGDGRIINQILATDLMCKDTQTKQSQTDGSPRLQASAGDNIALRYQENGHVTLPQNQPGKPDNRGTIYVYGTTQPQENDAFLSIHRVWNAEGTGGDGRGVLLSTQNYDDGQCYQVNGGQISTTRQKSFSHVATPLMGADLWCQQDIQIPTTAPSGKPYTLYWVWDWPTMPGTDGFPDGKQEIYTTCMDVDVTANGGQGGNGGTSGAQNKAAANSFAHGQDVGNAGIAAQLANIANPTAVKGEFIPFSGVSGQPSPTDNSGKQSLSATPPVASSAPPQVSGSSQVSGFASFATETATAVASATTPPPAANPLPPSASAPPSNPSPPFSHSRRPRPSVSPFDPQDPNPYQNGNPFQGPPGPPGQGNPETNRFPIPNNSQPPANLNTGTAISNAAAAPTTSAAAINAQTSTVTRYNSIIQTVTQTKMETVFSGTANQRRAEATQAPESIGASNMYPSIRACSRTESAYRLRARMPFYILSKVGVSGEEKGGAGC